MIVGLLAMGIGCTPGDYWYFRTDGVDLPVRVEGNLDSGVVLLMLHGGPGGSAVDYNVGLDAELLEDAYAIAYYDQRGQGGSHGRFGTDRYTVQQVADDNANLVRAIRARYGDDTSVWLYGHSWGGMLGTATLLDTDADVDGWIESAGSHDYPLNDTYSADLLLSVAAEEIAAGSRYTSEWKGVQRRVERILEDGKIGNYESIDLNIMAYDVEDYVKIVEGAYGEESLLGLLVGNPTSLLTAWWSGLDGSELLNDDAQTISYTDRLDEITVPSLFLYGARDFICPAQLGRDAHERVSTEATEFILYEDAGHSLMLSYPRQYAADIIRFVEAWR
ncbi:MAG: pimeloyl-ACP methyl ester carboxylesterase [Myxococcota bacterium]|jgi:pimeloyl-ACP methyl ester carboxylesterase